MTDWWIAALPIAGTLIGVFTTLLAQDRTLRRQRAFERNLRFFDEKKAAYVRYADIMLDLYAKLRPFHRDALTATSAAADARRAAESIAEVVQRLTSSPGSDDAMPQLREILNELVAGAAGMKAAQKARTMPLTSCRRRSKRFVSFGGRYGPRKCSSRCMRQNRYDRPHTPWILCGNRRIPKSASEPRSASLKPSAMTLV
jgi:hypothetical protein